MLCVKVRQASPGHLVWFVDPISKIVPERQEILVVGFEPESVLRLVVILFGSLIYIAMVPEGKEFLPSSISESVLADISSKVSALINFRSL